MTKIAKTYGESLYELAKDEGITAQLMDELTLLCGILKEEDKYITLLCVPSLTKDERKALIDESLTGFHQYIKSFVKLLMENGTLSEIFGCLDAYKESYYKDNNILAVDCTSAFALSDELVQKLIARLKEQTGKQIVLSQKIDPKLIGGIKLSVDGISYDGTIKNRLEEIQKRLVF